MLGKLKAGPIGFVMRAVRYRSFNVARIIQRHLPSIPTATHASEGKIAIPELGIVIDPLRHEEILKALPQLVSLRRNQGATFAMTADALLEIKVSGISILTETYQDILFAHEVFDTRVYELAVKAEAVVWDIGANIGMTSLYFASGFGWEVLAYEPFPMTAKAAQRNIERNNLGGNIELITAGVGGSARVEKLIYHHEWRGGNGIFGNLGEEVMGEGVFVEVPILDAATEFARLRERASGRLIIAKIDCEGAEYEILRRLRDTGDLKDIAIMALEVHRLPQEDPEEPRRILLESGMVILQHQRLSENLQTMFAVRVR